MLKDITFGQFYPGNSLLHRTDARFKIIILIVFLTAVLLAKTAAAFLLVLLALMAFLYQQLTRRCGVQSANL